MAAGDKERIDHDAFGKMRVEYWDITTNGSGTITIRPSMHRIKAVYSQWTQDIGLVPSNLECIPSSDKTTLVITNSAGLTKTANVMIIGYP